MSSRAYVAAFVALAVLVAATSSLASYYHRERDARATAHFARGQAALATGQPALGIDELRAALMLDRGNPQYSLLLAEALLESDRPREAGTYLETAMRADPTSGRANLVRAHIASAMGQDDAGTWFERAFVGSWPESAPAARVDVGLELARHLLDEGQAYRARAVLVRVAADTIDAARLQQAAVLLMEARAPADAAALLQGITRGNPDDQRSWHLLAEAEFTAGRDQAAMAAARRALALDASDARAKEIADVARTTLSLDPTAPRLGSAERRRRARELLRSVVAAYDACVPGRPEGAEADDPLAATRAVLLPRRRQAPIESDDLIDMATFAWALRTAACGPPGPDLAALARLMRRFETGSEAP